MRIYQKIAVSFLLIAVIPLSTLGIFAYVNSQHRASEQIDSQINASLSRQTKQLQALLNQDAIETSLIFGDPNDPQPALLRQYNAKPQPAQQQQLMTAVKAVVAASPHPEIYRRLHLVTPKGIIVASTDERFVGKDFQSNPAFRRGLEAVDVTHFFKDIDGALGQYRSNPVRFGKELVGVVVVEAEITPYFAIVNDHTYLGRTGETFIVGKDDGGKSIYLLPQRFNPDGALTPYAAGSASTVSNYRGRTALQSVQPLQNFDWSVGVMIDKDEVYGPVYAIRNTTLLVVGVTALAVFIIGWYLSHLITAPLDSFTKVVKQIMDGNLTQRVPLRSNDEIGVLSKAFNAMTAKIQGYYEELEATVRERTKQLETAQVKLQQNVKQDEALLSSIGDGVIATDRNGFITWVNKTATDMLQLPSQDILSRKYDEVWRLETEKGEPIPPEKHPISQALTTGQQVNSTDTYYARKDAQGALVVHFAVAATVAPVKLGEQLVGSIIVFRDVTHERQVDRMKTEFISLASHQLRTPLSAIRWFSEMLLSGDAGKLDSNQQEFAQNIYDSAERMIELVNSLLNISRIESGRIMIAPVPTDLAQLLDGIITDLKGKTETKKQTLVVSVNKNLPPINIDPRMIGQVYLNLLTNAIKYTPKGGEISVFVSRKDDQVVSQVSDNGYGIPLAEQGRMFQKFFRATNVTKVETDGTGLGMYLVKSIIESSGGKIWFESAEGKGTTFWFTLPMSGMKAKAGEVTLDGTRSI